jgi:hypothetical protein
LECIASDDARRAAGEFPFGSNHVLDLEDLRHFARLNGFPVPGPVQRRDYDDLVAADLLWRYGWSASVAGLAFDDWKTEHRREISEVMKHVLH